MEELYDFTGAPLIFFGVLLSFSRSISPLHAGVSRRLGGARGIASAHLLYLLYFEHLKESTCGNCVFI